MLCVRPGLSIYCLVFVLSLIQTKSSGKKEPQLRIASIRLACGYICGVFPRLLINVGGPSPLWAVPFLSRWAWVENELEQTNKEHYSMVSASSSWLVFLSWLSSVLYCDLRTFSSKVGFLVSVLAQRQIWIQLIFLCPLLQSHWYKCPFLCVVTSVHVASSLAGLLFCVSEYVFIAQSFFFLCFCYLSDFGF